MTILLDIDSTTFVLGSSQPRPFLKEFIERHLAKGHKIHFFTGADFWRLNEACRVLEQLGMDPKTVQGIRRKSLSAESCPMIDYRTSPSSSISIKCLEKAAIQLRVPVSELRLLDDMPMHDNPHADQRIQVPGYWGQPDDDYLLKLEL